MHQAVDRVHAPRAPVQGLHTNIARLALRVVGARLDRDRDGLLVFFVGVVLLRVAAAVYFLTDLLVAASPVVMLASFIAVARFTAYATRRVVGQWGGAGGACCEDHLAFCGELLGFARRTWLEKPDFSTHQKNTPRRDALRHRRIKKTQPYYTAPIISLNSLCAADSFR